MKKKVKKFHQFVKVERGPVNSAVIDLLKGNVFQVENRVITALEQGKYEEIEEFLESALAEDLIIEVDDTCWRPPCGTNQDAPYRTDEHSIELQVDDGVDVCAVLEKLSDLTFYRVVSYDRSTTPVQIPKLKIAGKEKDFQRCRKRACITGDFSRITESIYDFNKKLNSCWGEKMAITGDGKIRPCIYSRIVVGDIGSDNIEKVVEDLTGYWTLTKDKVEKCKDCELRYVCFDCREIAYRSGGSLTSTNPTCNYDPYKGTWND